jgi:hypothetical protein
MHPWTVVEGDPEARYWNFCDDPELVSKSLEDFRRWEKYPVIASFYELIKWLNGPDSVFETNDSALGEPHIDHATPEPVRKLFDADPIGIHGRITIFFRDLEFNAQRNTFDWLKQIVHDSLRDNVPAFPCVIMVGEWPHHFKAISKDGHALHLEFWAWGDDESLAFSNLPPTILLELFTYLSQQIKAQMQNAKPKA